MDTKTLQEYDRHYVWHPFTQMREWENDAPIVIERGEGSWLIDTDGNRWLDGVGSIWTNVHGHCRPEINEAIKRQVDRLEHSTLLGLANDQAALLAKRLVEITPEGLSKVFYSDNGSTAVEIGIKMAFQYWQHLGRPEKSRFISFKNAYHGDTIGAVSVGGIDLFHGVFRPLLFPTIQAPSPYCYRCELVPDRDPATCGMRCLAELERLMESHAAETAGLVIEPIVQGAGGMIVQPAGFVRKVRELCDRYDILMIADEVATGFGRTGKLFACEHEGISPDILCVAKGITGGYLPLAATLTSEEIYRGFLAEYRELRTFFHGHTYTGNPLACAAAVENIDLFRREQTLRKLQPKIRLLTKGLKRFQELTHVGEVRQRGFMVGIELVTDRKTKEPWPLETKMGIQVTLECRRNGLIIRPLGNVIVLMPPLSISARELTAMLRIVYQAVKRTTENAGIS